jgi:hypothetical protein
VYQTRTDISVLGHELTNMPAVSFDICGGMTLDNCHDQPIACDYIVLAKSPQNEFG